jgi:hypothetical protein
VKLVVLLVLLLACGTDDRHAHRLADPDAGVDALAATQHPEETKS